MGIQSIFKKLRKICTSYIQCLDVQEKLPLNKKESYCKISNLRHDNCILNNKQMLYKGKITKYYLDKRIASFYIFHQLLDIVCSLP
jgi:hypothetical protein